MGSDTVVIVLPLPWDTYEGDAAGLPPPTASESRDSPSEPSPVYLTDLKVLQEMFYELLCDHVTLLSRIQDAGIRKDSEIQRVFRVIAAQT